VFRGGSRSEVTSSYMPLVVFSGLVVECLPLDPRFVGSNLDEDDGFLRVIKIRSMTSFRAKVKVDPPRRKTLWHVKMPTSMKKILRRENLSAISRQVSPAFLQDVSGGNCHLCVECF
jgi:hypothetical protein